MQFKEKKVEYLNGEIHTYSFGEGDRVILALPPFPSSGLFYINFFSQYDPKTYKVITFDLPGWAGLSDNIFKNSSHTLQDYIEIAKEVLWQYKVKDFSVIGYSFGGCLTIKLASDLRDQVKNIVLVSPVFNKNKLSKDIQISLAKFARIFGLSSLIKLLIKNRLLGLYKQRSLSLDESKMQTIEALMNNADSKIILEDINTLFFKTDLSDYLKFLDSKNVLIVSSKDERDFFKKQAENIRENLDNEKSIIIEGIHEDFLIVQNAKLAKEIIEFLV